MALDDIQNLVQRGNACEGLIVILNLSVKIHIIILGVNEFYITIK